MVKTTVHPDPMRRFTSMVVAAFDLRRAELHLVAGTHEPTSKTVPPENRPGLIAAPHHAQLVAAFNGGFQAQHGGYGMMVGPDVFLPPREDACTIGLVRDGTVRIGEWTSLQAAVGEWRAYRQTPPCLLIDGELNPALESEWKRRRWGGAVDGKKEVRRSAMGVDATGQILFFGIAEEANARDVAAGMKAVGAVHAAQLDINWSYTRFVLYRSSDSGPPQEAGFLMPGLKHSSGEYVHRSSTRDFFYVTRR